MRNPQLRYISGDARLVPTCDYSVMVEMEARVAFRVCLSGPQACDLAIRLQYMKDLGHIVDWQIAPTKDLALSELLCWVVSMSSGSPSSGNAS